MIKSYNYKENKIYQFYSNIRRNYIYNLMVINKDRIWETGFMGIMWLYGIFIHFNKYAV